MMRFSRFCSLLLLYGMGACSQPVRHEERQPEPPSQALVPYRYQEGFATGEVNGWDSYPPAQDTAFDPTFGCAAIESGYALEKAVKPTARGPLELGMIKKLSFVADPATSIAFRYRIKSNSKIHPLKVTLCADDGRLLSASIDPTQTGRETSVTVTGSDWAIARTTPIQAILFSATIADADTETTYRLLIDDISVSALRAASVRVLNPSVTTYPHWNTTLFNRHYRAGDVLDLSVDPEVPLLDLEVSLYDESRHQVALRKSIAPPSSTPLWAVPNLYRFDHGDQPGIWEVRFRGMTARGESMTYSAYFLLVRANPSPRPRVMVTSPERDRLIASVREDRKGEWDKLRQIARRQRQEIQVAAHIDIKGLNSRELLPTFMTYANLLRQTSEFIGLQALVYTLDNDHEAAQAARRGLLSFCSWETWAHPWITAHGQHTYWPVGIASSELAMAYDLLYPILTDDERALIRKAFLDKVILPAYREYVLADRVPFNTSNWAGIILGGALATAMSLYGDETDDSTRELEPYVSGMIWKLRQHLSATFREGGYGEGVGYQCFNLIYLTRGLSALDNTLGIDLAMPFNVHRSTEAALYALISPERGTISFGDSRPVALEWGYSALAWLAQKYPHEIPLQWLYQTFVQKGGSDTLSLKHRLLYPSAHDEVPDPRPNLPPSRSFPQLGLTFLRSGWKADDMLLAFKCGPFYNHHHLDQGSFHLWAYGEEFLSEAGVTDYYGDPNYAKFFIQPIGHNTLLVDGHPESQRTGDFDSEIKALTAHASVTSTWFHPAVDYVQGSLAPIYRGALSRYTREFFFIKPDYFVLLDRVAAAERPRTLDWIFHTPARKGVVFDADRIEIQRPRARLEMHVNATLPWSASMEPSPPSVDDKDATPGFIRIRTDSAATEVVMMTVLVPSPASAPGTKDVRSLQTSEALGFFIQNGSSSDLIWSRTSEIATKYALDRVRTDARFGWLRVDSSGAPRVLMLQAMTRFELQPTDATPGLKLTSEKPLAMLMEFTSEAIRVTYDAETSHRFQVDRGTPVQIETTPGRHSFELSR